MERYTILSPGPPTPSVETSAAADETLEPRAETKDGGLEFPENDGGKSLADAARRDLHSALQLLAERAQSVTGARGAQIALREEDAMVCRASAGDSVAAAGTNIRTDGGLHADCLRGKNLVLHGNVENLQEADRETWRQSGINSQLLLPLLQGEEAVGIFELVSGKPGAFVQADEEALQRLGEMVLTAIEHAKAATQVLAMGAAAGQGTGSQQTAVQASSAGVAPATSVPKAGLIFASPEPAGAATTGTAQPDILPPVASEIGRGDVHACEVCGFPVSGQRSVCIDCEQTSAGTAAPVSQAAPAFLTETQEEGGLSGGAYFIAFVLVAAATVAAAYLYFR